MHAVRLLSIKTKPEPNKELNASKKLKLFEYYRDSSLLSPRKLNKTK